MFGVNHGAERLWPIPWHVLAPLYRAKHVTGWEYDDAASTEDYGDRVEDVMGGGGSGGRGGRGGLNEDDDDNDGDGSIDDERRRQQRRQRWQHNDETTAPTSTAF